MKKFLWMLILLLIPCLSAGAEAQEITGSCTLTYAAGSWGQGDMRDQSYLTYYNGRYLEVKTPADAPCYGVYLCLSGEDVGYCIQTQDAEGNWEISLQDDRGYVNSYLPLPGLRHHPGHHPPVRCAHRCPLCQYFRQALHHHRRACAA